MHYYVYSKSLIGIETNADKFIWTFGTIPPRSDSESFSQCLIRIHMNVVSDSQAREVINASEGKMQFGNFKINRDKGEISFDKRMLKLLKLALNLRIEGNDIYLTVGKTYYNFVKLRMMNIHSVGYILSDLTAGLLLINGYAPIYASAVSLEGRNIIMFGAPQTGKTFTATGLCNEYGGGLLSEDVAVTDGSAVWSVPFTSTYGQHDKKDKSDIPINKGLTISKSDMNYVFLLEKGEKQVKNLDSAYKLILLNRHIFHYYSSPISLVCSYFFDNMSIPKMEEQEAEILTSLLNNSKCYEISASDPLDFLPLVKEKAE